MAHFEKDISDGCMILKFVDEKIYDDATILQIGEELFSIIETGEQSTYKLDFSNVNYLSSSMLGKIISANKKAKEKQAKIILKNTNENILEIFQITRLDKFFTFEN